MSLKKRLLFSFDVMKIKCMYSFQYVLFSQFLLAFLWFRLYVAHRIDKRCFASSLLLFVDFFFMVTNLINFFIVSVVYLDLFLGAAINQNSILMNWSYVVFIDSHKLFNH